MIAAVAWRRPRPSAQTAELRGSVADSTGSALPGVTVTIVNTATGVERVVVTDEQGGVPGAGAAARALHASSRA